MARQQVVAFGGTGIIIAEDSAGTASTLVLRDASGNTTSNQVAGSELKSTGIVTVAVSASKTSSFTVDGTATVWPCNATGGAIVPTLPAAAAVPGRVYWFKKTDASGNNVTVTGSGAETIDGSNTKALTAQYQKVAIVSDGTQWHILV